MFGSVRSWLLLLPLLALATPANAQTIDGALRLHVETGAFGVTRLTRTRDSGSSAWGTILSVGPTNTGLGAGVGFGVSEAALVGLNLSLQVMSLSDDDSDTTTMTRAALAPYVEILFGSGSTRPFVGAQGTLGYTKIENSNATTLGLMGQVGAHFFLSEGGSFDLSARPFVETSTDEDDDTLTSYGLLVMIGVSAWSH